MKSLLLSDVSLYVIQIGYGVLPEFECAEYEDAPVYGDKINGTWSFFVWIRLWLNWLCGGRGEPFNEQAQRPPNRHNRRMKRRVIPPARNLMPYYQLLAMGPNGRGLSRTQFLERLCRLSVFGRIRIYQMRQSGSVLRRRAMLICYDHGWWRAPLGIFGRVYCGIWHVHLLPGWLRKLTTKHQNQK